MSRDDGDGDDANAHPTDDNISVMTGASGNYALSMDGSSAANKEAYAEQQLESRDVFDCYHGDEHGLLAGKQRRDLDNDNESQSTVRSIQHLPIQTSKEEKPPLIKETSEKWNHLTNPFQQVMKPFVSLVCMPRTLRCSEVMLISNRVIWVLVMSILYVICMYVGRAGAILCASCKFPTLAVGVLLKLTGWTRMAPSFRGAYSSRAVSFIYIHC